MTENQELFSLLVFGKGAGILLMYGKFYLKITICNSRL